MQTPGSRTPVSRILASVRFLLAALAQLSTTADLTAALQASFDAFVTAVAATVAADDAVIQPRVALRFAERDLEIVIRGIWLAAQALDGGKPGGRIASALFPNGLKAVVVPQTVEQNAVAKQLLDRLLAQHGAEPLRAIHEPALRSAIERMTQRLAERDAAFVAYDTAFARQTAARSELVRAYDIVANTVRARFPKDRAQQDIFFDVLLTTSKDDGQDPVVPATTPTVTNGTPAA